MAAILDLCQVRHRYIGVYLDLNIAAIVTNEGQKFLEFHVVGPIKTKRAERLPAPPLSYASLEEVQHNLVGLPLSPSTELSFQPVNQLASDRHNLNGFLDAATL